MKHFKTKIFSLLLCLCFSLSLLTGCSLFVKKDTLDKNAVALTIGDAEVTNEELINAYYSFYQQNYYYFMYYETEEIMEIFYNSVVSREIVLAEANKMLESGDLVFTEEDMQDVWNDVYDYIYSQIDTKEKSILLLADSDEEKLPERLQKEDEDDEKALVYEPYEFEEIVPIDYTTKTAHGEVDVDAKIAGLNIYEYNASKVEDEREMKAIEEAERTNRYRAYEMYLSDLMLSAKSNGKDSSKEAVLKAEVQRIYESYYESALYTMYQEYIESTASGEIAGYENKFSDAKIAEKYKKLLATSKEGNTLQDNYVSVVTASDNESLILYHYDGKYTYFTVQHILISFSDDVLDVLKATDGYDANKDALYREYYEAVRETYATEDMTTSYRNEDGYTAKNDDGSKKTITRKEIVNQFFNVDLPAKLAELPAGASQKDIERVKTLLFQEYAWKYSGDTGSLSNELKGVLGFTISEETDEHGNFVKDFANGARELYKAYLINSTTNGIGSTIRPVVSDYGVHLMMLTGVYEEGEVVQVKGKTDTQIVEDLKANYVSNLTTQTLYEYVYDLIKDELFGDKGTYFTDHRNALVKKYENEGLVDYVKKLTYEQLEAAIK